MIFSVSVEAPQISTSSRGALLNRIGVFSTTVNGVVASREVNKGRSGGRHYEYELGCPTEMIIERVDGDSRISDLDDRL